MSTMRLPITRTLHTSEVWLTFKDGKDKVGKDKEKAQAPRAVHRTLWISRA